MVEDIEFRDESDDSYGEKTLSIKEIILRHIRKISDLSCQEFTGGFWEEKPVKTQGGIMFMRKWHDDVRQAYCNAVDFLLDIIYPMSDSELKTYLKEKEDYEKEELKNWGENIVGKLARKRMTFRQINIMFERTNFWKGTGSYNE